MPHNDARPELLKPDPTIRGFRTEDAAGFRKIVRSVLGEFGYAGDSKYDSDLDNPEAHYDRIWVIESADQEIVGSVAIKQRSPQDAQIKRMYIHPELRGRGYGQQLLAAAFEWAERENVTTLWLVTTDLMEQAKRFYERAGFRQVDTFPSWDHTNPHDLFYRLDLPSDR